MRQPAREAQFVVLLCLEQEAGAHLAIGVVCREVQRQQTQQIVTPLRVAADDADESVVEQRNGNGHVLECAELVACSLAELVERIIGLHVVFVGNRYDVR